MSIKTRDEFSQTIRVQIAKRAAWLCSFPSCRKFTVGATEDGNGEINIGTAAHICAAAPGGPRYDDKMSRDQRSSADNGIWLCRDHGKTIDSDLTQFTTPVLREMKRQAEQAAFWLVSHGGTANTPAADFNLATRLRDAVEKDLAVFRKTAKWPATVVPLRLEVDGFDTPVSTDAETLARVVTSLDDLFLVAGPGMGKTTTVFQVAECLFNNEGAPLVVLLNDWATEGTGVLESILKRPAFQGISEGDIRKAAAQPGVVLLRDGWNELEANARTRSGWSGAEGGGSTPLQRGGARGRRPARTQGMSPLLSVIPPRIHRSPNG